MDCREILVPTDFSEHARAALEHALELAEVFGASLTILHAYHLLIPMSVPPTGGGFRMPGHVARELRQRAQAAVDGLVEAHARSGRILRARAVESSPVQAILAEVERSRVDLIVMGTHGRTGIAHLVLGSVARRIVQMAPCPVLTLRWRGL
jgi:nucleotide-binding universal stress UspA family protein